MEKLQRFFKGCRVGGLSLDFGLARENFFEKGATLVQLARKETDPELRKEAVEKLSLMKSGEGAECLMELLNK